MTDDHTLMMQAIGIPHKGVVLDASYATVANPQTAGLPRKGPSGNGATVLQVTFSDGVEKFTHDIPNTGFDFGNPAFHFLAACGARPSDLEACRGTFVPIVDASEIDGMDEKGLASVLMEDGRSKLAESVWGPDPPNDDGND